MQSGAEFDSPERVYFGGPFEEVGVVSFGGRPHEYELVFDELADEYSDVCLLRALDDAEFAARTEMWALEVQFRRAYRAGEVPYRVPNVLPEHDARYAELHSIATMAKAKATRSPTTHRAAKARFELLTSGDRYSRHWQVRWSPIGNMHIGDTGTGSPTAEQHLGGC